MLEIRDKSASGVEVRKRDISSWQEARITSLNSKAKKRFSKNKSAVTAYFTSDKPIEEIATEHNLSTEQLLKMAENCLKQHEDGSSWGYRALLPGVLVKDYSSSPAPTQPEEQDTPTDAAPKQATEEDDDEDALASTAKRPVIRTKADSLEEIQVDVVSSQPVDLNGANGTDHSQHQPVEASPAPVLENSEEASFAEVAESTDGEIAEQSEKTQLLSADVSTAPDDTEISVPDTSSPPDDIDANASLSESEVASDAQKTPTVESDAASDTPTVPAAESEISSEATVESDAASDPSEISTADANATIHEPTSSMPQELLGEETPLTEPIEIQESAEEIEAAPTLIEDQASDAFSDAQKQGTFPEEEAYVENEVTSVAIIDDAQIQPLASTTFTLPDGMGEPANNSPVDIYLLPKYVRHSTRTTTAHMAQRRRVVRKRWLRDAQDKTKRHRFYRTVSIVMVAVILLSLLLPLGVGLAAYNVYNNVNGLAHDGINHLMSVKDLLPTSKNDIMSTLNANKLQQAQVQLKAAEVDFLQLQQLADRPDVQSIVQQVAPQYAGKLMMAKHLLQVALDVSRMGQELSGVGVIAANIVHSSPLAGNTAKPLISVSDISDIKGAITHALYYMDDIQQNMSQVQLKDLPVNAKQQAQLSSVMAQLPSIRSLILQNQNMVDVVAWLLGVGQTRHFLMQTMDTAEIRGGGGFTGQYGVLSIQNGRVAPFTLHDVSLIDYASNGMNRNRLAPSQYGWMNFGSWGLRDSNLSADYPTTAQINTQVFQEQGGGPDDGVIDFTPAFIAHILNVTGPIRVALYNETITSSNLEERLHYYQQDPNAIAIEEVKSNDYGHQARKEFTSLVGKLLLSKVSHLPTNKLLTILKDAVKDIQSRDLEIYFTNPVAEQWLVNNGYSGGMSTFSKQDGLMVVQSNMSISKASQYVHTTEQDNISLDAQGGATHNLAITLDYNQTGPVYGFDTYSDYMRVYTPKSAQFLSGDGFDTGQPACMVPPPPTQNGKNGNGGNGGKNPPPSTCDTLPASQTLYCASGNYSLGVRSYNLPKTADVMGAPPAMTSDLPGRGMFGGMTVTPKDCTSTIMLSWYVPNAVKHVGKSLVYPLLIQKQGGYTPSLEIDVDASAIKGMKSFTFKGDLHADRLFNIL